MSSCQSARRNRRHRRTQTPCFTLVSKNEPHLKALVLPKSSNWISVCGCQACWYAAAYAAPCVMQTVAYGLRSQEARDTLTGND